MGVTGMVKKILPTIIAMVLSLLAVITVGQSYYEVAEDEIAIKTAFSKVVSVETTAGLKFKIPFIHTITILPKNDMLYDIAPSLAITKDKKNLNVDSYCVWRIEDPLKFWQQVGGDISRGERRIDAQTYNATKNRFGEMTQDDIFAEREGALDVYVTEYVRTNIEDAYGVKIVNINIKQIVPPEDNLQAIYTRMISEREQMSVSFRADGEEAAQIVMNEADRECTVLIAEAKAEAAKITAEGEREYMRILSEAYGSTDRVEFYEFIRAMDALKEMCISGQKTLVLPLDSPLARWFVQK